MRRSKLAACVTRVLAAFAMLAVAASGKSHGAFVGIALPTDFNARFVMICQKRGLSEAQCLCMTEVVLREVADENLALMLAYFENPAGFDDRALQELDNDERRLAMLAEEINAAQQASHVECRQR